MAIYFAATLGGSTLFYLLGPDDGATLGAAPAVVGLLAANAIGKRKSGEDVRGDVGLFVILVLYSLVVGFASFGWLTMIGGILVGALAGVRAGVRAAAQPQRHPGRRAARRGRGLPGRVVAADVRGRPEPSPAQAIEDTEGTGHRGQVRLVQEHEAHDQADQQQHREHEDERDQHPRRDPRAAVRRGRRSAARRRTGRPGRRAPREREERRGQSPPREKAASRSCAE